MEKQEIKIGDRLILKGFERNRTVCVRSFEEIPYLKNGKLCKYHQAWVQMPEGDLLNVDIEELCKP